MLTLIFVIGGGLTGPRTLGLVVPVTVRLVSTGGCSGKTRGCRCGGGGGAVFCVTVPLCGFCVGALGMCVDLNKE